MTDGHGPGVTARRFEMNDRLSIMSMHQNMHQSVTNTLWGCGLVFTDRLGQHMPNLAHTVGMAERGLPELAMLGVGEMPEFLVALELLSRLWEDNSTHWTGNVPGHPDWRLVELDLAKFRDGYGRAMGLYYGYRKLPLRVMQLIIRDERGQWPDQPDYQWQCGRPFLLPVKQPHMEVLNANRA